MANGYDDDQFHNITETNQLRFQWTFNASATQYSVTIYENNTPVGTTQIWLNGDTGTDNTNFGVLSVDYGINIAGNNYVQFNGAVTPNTTYYIIAVPSDGTNDIATEYSDIITMDLSAPATGGASVSDPGTYTTTTPILFTWAGFTDAGAGISYYEVESCDGMVLGVSTACDVSIDAHWSATPTAVAGTVVNTSGYGTELFADGETVALRVRAIDKAGNKSAWVASDGITVNASVGDIGAITDNTGGDGARGSLEDTTVTFYWDDLGTDGTGYTEASGFIIQVYELTTGKSVEYQGVKTSAFANNAAVGITSPTLSVNAAPDPNQMVFSFTAVEGRKYYIKVKAYDDAGNESPNWVESSVVVVDTSNPVVSSLLDTSNSGTYTGVVTKSNATNQVTFTWAGSDTGSDISQYQLQISNTGGVYNNTYPPTTSCVAAVGWSTTTTTTGTALTTGGFGGVTIADGNVVCFRVQAVDGAGNLSGWTTSDGILVDKTAPVITDMWPGVNGPGDSFKRPMLAEQGNVDANNNRLGRIYWDDSTDAASGIDYYEVEVTHSCGEVCYFNYKVRADRIGAASLLSYTQYRLSATSIINTASTALGNDTDTLAPADGKYLNFEYTNGEFACTYSTVIIRVYDKAGNMTQSFISDELNI
ncbi:MAG: hypothetical protein CVV50_02350 [Spirochaetae bacterium HGW-Spirochaetae-6]|nr:MAG: hypothetical protein CVV50_02350 [Spirochaetae bacterium HGW-Spirochaetae-6]